MMRMPKKFPTTTADRSLAGMYGPVTCVIQLELEFAHRLDEQRLSQAVSLIMDAEPILGCRFVPNRFRPIWQRLEKEKLDAYTLTESKIEYEAFRHSHMDFFSGPQILACHYRSQSMDRLLLKISHLWSDAAGVKDIVSTLSTIYNRLADEPDYYPPINSNQFRGFWQIVKHIPWYVHPRIVVNYLHEIWTSSFPRHSQSIPIKKATNNTITFIKRSIEKEQFAHMVAYAKEHRSTINDILLTAIFRALSKTGKGSSKSTIRLGVTVDLRRYLPNKKAKSITNFSAIEIITYGTDIEKAFEQTLVRVNERMNKRKSSWLGLSGFISAYLGIWPMPFFILRILGKKGWELRCDKPNSSDLLTNMGEVLKKDVDFDGPPTDAWLLPPGCFLPMLFFGCSAYDGTLTLSCSMVPNEENKAAIDNFFDHILSELPLTRSIVGENDSKH